MFATPFGYIIFCFKGRMLKIFFIFGLLHIKNSHWRKTLWNKYKMHKILIINFSYIMSSFYTKCDFVPLACTSPILALCLPSAYLCLFVCLFGWFSVFLYPVFRFSCLSVFLSLFLQLFAVIWTVCPYFWVNWYAPIDILFEGNNSLVGSCLLS